MYAELGAEVPEHRQEQPTQTLIVCLYIKHFFKLSVVVKSQQNIIELVARPGFNPMFNVFWRVRATALWNLSS